MTVRGKNLVFNGYFGIEAADVEFPMGWVKIFDHPAVTLEWSTDLAVVGQHTVKVRNVNYCDGLAGIVQDHRYSIEVEPGAAWELAAWMRTERAGVPLRLIAVFMKSNWEYHSESHLKFVSTTEMRRYSGIIYAPEGAAWLKIACGVHDNPETLPSNLWISWVTLRKIS
ncbi:MAG: hypothetical protein QHH75_12665 [Bacillota bacterium]|nr:hypothetical protein [Bacillota bacterium]